MAFLGASLVYNLVKPLVWWPLALGSAWFTYIRIKGMLGLNSTERRSVLEQLVRQGPMRQAQKMAQVVSMLTIDVIERDTGKNAHPMGPAAVTSVQQTVMNGFQQTRIEMELPVQIGENIRMVHVVASDSADGIALEKVEIDGLDNFSHTQSMRFKPKPPGVIDVDFEEVKKRP